MPKTKTKPTKDRYIEGFMNGVESGRRDERARLLTALHDLLGISEIVGKLHDYVDEAIRIVHHPES